MVRIVEMQVIQIHRGVCFSLLECLAIRQHVEVHNYTINQAQFERTDCYKWYTRDITENNLNNALGKGNMEGIQVACPNYVFIFGMK